MSDIGCSEVNKLLQHLDTLTKGERKPIALKQIIQQSCANMFCRYMCSVRFDYDDAEFQNIVRCFDEIFWEINQGYAVDFLPWLSPFYTRHMRKIIKWSETIRKFILDRIIATRECNISTDLPERDFTDALMQSLAKKEGLTRDTLIYMLEDFIGGHSAVGNLVMLALAHIVKNPSACLQIQAEICNVLDQNHRLITQMDAERMPYTMSTIYEVLRFCSSPIVPHVATEDVPIAGYGVTKGTVVFINNYELNTSPKYWEQPQKFDPERFLIPLNSLKVNTLNKVGQHFEMRKNIPHFMPFSIGKRTCVGQNLVKGFGFTLLANIMQTYDISCDDLTKIQTYPACVALPPDTFSLILTPRTVLHHTSTTIDVHESSIKLML